MIVGDRFTGKITRVGSWENGRNHQCSRKDVDGAGTVEPGLNDKPRGPFDNNVAV